MKHLKRFHAECVRHVRDCGLSTDVSSAKRQEKSIDQTTVCRKRKWTEGTLSLHPRPHTLRIKESRLMYSSSFGCLAKRVDTTFPPPPTPDFGEENLKENKSGINMQIPEIIIKSDPEDEVSVVSSGSESESGQEV